MITGPLTKASVVDHWLRGWAELVSIVPRARVSRGRMDRPGGLSFGRPAVGRELPTSE